MKRKAPTKLQMPRLLTRSLERFLWLHQPEPLATGLEKIDESLTPNMRALRLSMTLAEHLLSMGVTARDVVYMTLGITDTYCTRRVHMDVSSTLIMLSQDRGVDREPLTLMRTIRLAEANYQLMQALQSLALEIRDEYVPLAEAERRLEDILRQPKRHNRWKIYTAGGIVSGGVVLLYDGSPLMIGLSFALGFLATGFLRWMSRLGLSTFYSQIITAILVTLTSAAIAWACMVLNITVNTTLLVIGGIVLLVAGMMIVGAFQDAIDEYYVTANARLLKVMMATGGIVVGVTGGLYIATRFGISFPTTPDHLTLAETQLQYVGALIIAAAFAARNHAPLFGTVVSGSVGVFGWWIARVMLHFDFGIVLASGTAAAAVGLMATLMSRFWRFPSVAIVAAGIVPLVPGLSLYNGLMGVIDHPPSDPQFMMAMAVLARAVMIGLAVATGASLGSLVGRPLRRRVIRVYSQLPRRRR